MVETLQQVQKRIRKSFANLVFKEDKHWYFVEKDYYPSVSSKVRGHVEEVNFEAILPYSAQKQTRETGIYISPEELGKKWKTTNEEACRLGHETHSFLERWQGHDVPRTGQQVAGVKFLKSILTDYDIVGREVRGYSKEFKYAGTMDLPIRNRNTGAIVIADFKTNGDLFKNYKGKTLLPPFDFLEETPYNEYQLQLSYYQIMLEEIGIKVQERWLIHLGGDGNYKIFKLWDLTKEIKEYLSTHHAA